MMNTYTLTLGAGERWETNVSGRLFRIIEASKSGALDVEFFNSHGLQGRANDVGAGFWARPTVTFGKIVITSAVAQTVTFIVGAGDAGFDRVTVAGQVEVIDTDALNVAAGRVFNYAAVHGGAGTYGGAALIAAAGKRLTVHGIYGTPATATTVFAGWTNAAQIAAWGALTDMGYGRAMRSDATVLQSVSHAWIKSGGFTTPPTSYCGGFHAAPTTGYELEFRHPFVIQPGDAFLAYMTTAALVANLAIKFTEEDA